MKKRISCCTIVLLSIVLLASCSSLASLIGLDGLAGFDSVSKKALSQGFIEIDWLSENPDLEEVVASLCDSGKFSVSYSDQYRMLEFVAFNSCLKLHVFNNRIEVVYEDRIGYDDSKGGIGWFSPKSIELQCYGENWKEVIYSDEVSTTNEEYYNEFLKKYSYTRYQDICHIFSVDASNFLNETWNNNTLYVVVNGSSTTKTYTIKNNDLINIYRTLYEALFPYEYLATATESSLIEFVNGLKTINEYQADAIYYYINQNESVTKDQLNSLANLLTSKIR